MKFLFPIFIRGLFMGMADVVPGVSGGTIAFITGIYEELINTIKNLTPTKLKVLKNEGFAKFWEAINGNFLISLVAGIGISIVSLAKVITFLLTNYPILLFSFFFGLIVASAVFIGKQIKTWKLQHIITLLFSMVIAYYITVLTPSQGNDSLWFLVLSGAIAICAMILPGISGAFLLLILGQYERIIEAIKTFDFSVILPVGLGAIVGLLTFSRVLSWLFKHYKELTLASLTGFVIGALNKVWPWKEILESRVDSHGVEQPLIERSILPNAFTELTDSPNYLLPAIGLAAIGFIAVFAMEKLANNYE